MPEFGTTLPGKPVDVPGRVVLIHGVLVFGWAGSPGEYMAFAWAAKHGHERRRPGEPALNDTVRFASKWLMDDGVVLEPLVGIRPWLSADVLPGNIPGTLFDTFLEKIKRWTVQNVARARKGKDGFEAPFRGCYQASYFG